MTAFDQRFYTINRFILSLVGLWPYVDRRERLLRGFLTEIGLFAGIFVQTMRLVISRHNDDLIIEILSYMMSSMLVTLMYSAFYFEKNSEQIKLFDSIDTDWEKIQNTEEYDILRKFAEETRTVIIILLSITYLHVGLVVPASTIPLILDIINPLNKTRQTKFVPLLEYFSGRERCILKILPIYYLAMLCLGIAVTAVIVVLLTCVQHTCSMFAVTGYLITHALSEQSIRAVDDVYEDSKTYARVVRAMKHHKRALDFLDRINAFMEKPSLCMHALMLSLTAFEISQINKIDIKCISLMVTQILLISVINLNGQKIINYSSSVFESAVMARWYLAPVRTQKLFLLIMMRSMRPSYLWIGGLYVSSNEFCLSLIKTSVSYGMVLYSIR